MGEQRVRASASPSGGRRWSLRAQGAVLALAAVGMVSFIDRSDDGGGDRAASEVTVTTTVTVPVAPEVSTTTIVVDTTTATPAPTTAAEAVAVDLPDGRDTTVSAHVDGDTLKVASGETIRLIGIDTPETKHPSEPVGCYGAEASRHTADLLPLGSAVRLVHDVERLDRYGRTLAYVHRVDDGLFLNLALVRDGFAQVSTYPPNVAHVEDLTRAQGEAREVGRGLWGPVCAAPPPTVAPPAVPPEGGSTSAYESCSAARQAGAAPVLEGDPGFGSHLDADHDGIGCES